MTVKYCESVGLNEMRLYISADKPEDGLLSPHVRNNDLLTTAGVSQLFLLIINHIEILVQLSLYITLELVWWNIAGLSMYPTIRMYGECVKNRRRIPFHVDKITSMDQHNQSYLQIH